MALALVKSETDAEHGTPLPLKLSQIVPDPEQPRKTFIKRETEQLADSIQAESQETPVHVFKHPDPGMKGIFMLSAGERRWRAFHIIAQRTGTDPIVMAYIKVITDKKTRRRKAILENLHRKDLVPLDEAGSYASLIEDGESLDDIAEFVGKSRSHVDNYLKLNDLCPEVRALMDPELRKEKQLSVTSAIDIVRSYRKNPTLQFEIAREVVDRQLGVNDVRLLLGVRAEDPDYKTGQKFRHPSDDYKVFKSFLGRTLSGAIRHSEANLGRLYANREDEEEDRQMDITEISNIKIYLDRMIKQLRDTQ